MRTRVLLVPLLLFLTACTHGALRNSGSPSPGTSDPHSYANTDAFRTRHVRLDLQVDFAQLALQGVVELELERLRPATTLVLDTRDLMIASAEAASGEGPWQPVAFTLHPQDPVLGAALEVALGDTADRVRLRYRTHPEASGLQWLAPEQTAGRRHPFLFSQSQAIHARSWIPLQDTPGVRSTYEAQVTVPPALRAVMSAEVVSEDPKQGEYRFRMPQPIPSYLMAIAVGDLRFRALGPRTGVYAEPALIAAAAREFEDTERMLEVCESLFGPYRWGRYDLLILPPSFPYGGMENPRLTFASPTTIAGDKSLVALVAHELAHSWSGNLVTNASWRDFWLNEGFTTYLTYRIMEAVYGSERGMMERALGAADLREALQKLPAAARTLSQDLAGRDPDEGVTDIPYERGALFLTWLESRVGRPAFDAFLRGWFDSHAFRSVTREDFLAYLERELMRRHPQAIPEAVVQAWIHSPEIPGEAVWPVSPAFAAVDAERQAWLAGEKTLASLPTQAWTVHEWRRFLDAMPGPLTRGQMAALDRRFQFSRSRNAFVATSWFRLAIANNYRPAYPHLERHLNAIGRMLLIRPLYEALAATAEGRAFAQKVYARARQGYHPIARTAIERVLAEDTVATAER